jgi:hypothetical protein
MTGRHGRLAWLPVMGHVWTAPAVQEGLAATRLCLSEGRERRAIARGAPRGDQLGCSAERVAPSYWRNLSSGRMTGLVGQDRSADRASNDADVSSIPPNIPYGDTGAAVPGWPDLLIHRDSEFFFAEPRRRPRGAIGNPWNLPITAGNWPHVSRAPPDQPYD